VCELSVEYISETGGSARSNEEEGYPDLCLQTSLAQRVAHVVREEGLDPHEDYALIASLLA